MKTKSLRLTFEAAIVMVSLVPLALALLFREFTVVGHTIKALQLFYVWLFLLVLGVGVFIVRGAAKELKLTTSGHRYSTTLLSLVIHGAALLTLIWIEVWIIRLVMKAG